MPAPPFQAQRATLGRRGYAVGKLLSFTSVSLDGYFADLNGGLDWAHSAKRDPEFDAEVGKNAGSGGTLLLGRVTYELMASYWPTPAAANADPIVAEGMNRARKIVASRTMRSASWANAHVLSGNLVAEVRSLKAESDEHIAILGSGSIVSQLAQARLIDECQIVVVPIVLGMGRSLFAGVEPAQPLELTASRAFANGNVLLTYRFRR